MPISDPNSSWDEIKSSIQTKKDIYPIIRKRDEINLGMIRELYQAIGQKISNEEILIESCHRRRDKSQDFVMEYIEESKPSPDTLISLIKNDRIEAGTRLLMLSSLNTGINLESDPGKKEELTSELRRITDSLLEQANASGVDQNASQVPTSSPSVLQEVFSSQDSRSQGLSQAFSKAASEIVEAVGVASDRLGISEIEPSLDLAEIKKRLPNLSEEDRVTKIEQIIRERDSLTYNEAKDLYNVANTSKTDEAILLDLISLKKEKSLDFLGEYLSEDRKNLSLLWLIDDPNLDAGLKERINSKLDRSALKNEVLQLSTEKIASIIFKREGKSEIASLTGVVSGVLTQRLRREESLGNAVDLYLQELGKSGLASKPLLTALRASFLDEQGNARDFSGVDSKKLERMKESLKTSNIGLAESVERIIDSRYLKEENITEVKAYINGIDRIQAKQDFIYGYIEASVRASSKIGYQDIGSLLEGNNTGLDEVGVVKTILAGENLKPEQKKSFIENLGPIPGKDLISIASNLEVVPSKELAIALINNAEEDKLYVITKVASARIDIGFDKIKEMIPEEERQQIFLNIAEKRKNSGISSFIENMEIEEISLYCKGLQPSPELLASINEALVDQGKQKSFSQDILPSRIGGKNFNEALQEAGNIGVPEDIRFEVTANASLRELSDKARDKKLREIANHESKPTIEEMAKLGSVEYKDHTILGYSDQAQKIKFLKEIVKKKPDAEKISYINEQNLSTEEKLAFAQMDGLENAISKERYAKVLLFEKHKLPFEIRITQEEIVRNGLSQEDKVEIICDHFLHSDKHSKQDNKGRAIEELEKCGLTEKQAKSYYFHKAEEAKVEVPKTLMERMSHFVDKIFTSEREREERFTKILSNLPSKEAPVTNPDSQTNRSDQAHALRNAVVSKAAGYVIARRIEDLTKQSRRL